MSLKLIFKLILVIGALLLVKSCFFPTRAHRKLKITAEVVTPQGLRMGSSVIDFVYTDVPRWLPGSIGVSRQVIGEATVVDLGNGRFLLVLLHDQYWSHDVSALLDDRRREADGTVKATWMPMLVTFKDATDATSIVEVAPDNLAAVFGAGYALRRVVAEPTTDQPTFGTLNQIPAVRDGILTGTLERQIAKNPSLYVKTALQLTSSAFQQSAPK